MGFVIRTYITPVYFLGFILSGSMRSMLILFHLFICLALIHPLSVLWGVSQHSSSIAVRRGSITSLSRSFSRSS